MKIGNYSDDSHYDLLSCLQKSIRGSDPDAAVFYTAKLLEVGYDAQTAASMAMNLPEGISDDFFNQQKSFLETQKQIAKTNAINNQSSMSVGETPSATKADEEDAKLKKWFYGY